jgi:hypothetical protein
MKNNQHIEIVKRFVEKYENYESIDDEDVEDFMEDGLYQLLDEYEVLIEMSVSLVEEIINMFPERELKKLRGTNFHTLLTEVLKITTENKPH